MQVILFKNIEKLGLQGDVVNVAPGFYRNFLGPRGIAVEATPGSLSRLEAKRKKLRAEAERQLGEADAIAKQLKDVTLTWTMKAIDEKKIFGSIQEHDILAKLTEKGFNLEKRQVALREPIKTLGSHSVRIKLLGHVEGQITVVVEAEGAEPAPAAETPAE